MPSYNFDLATLVPGYFNAAGIFQADTLDGSGNRYRGSADVKTKPVFRGPCIAGPVSGAATSNQYLYPDQASLVQNTHFFMEAGTVLSGSGVATDTPTAAYQTDGSTPVIVTATVQLYQPANQGAPVGNMPTYWYLILDPRGSSQDLTPLAINVFSILQTLPVVAATLPGTSNG